MPQVVTADANGRDWRFTHVDMGSKAATDAKAAELVAEARGAGYAARIEKYEDEDGSS